ncbi:MAG: glycosyltransferase family 4 protein [Chitinispirillaceae bacterium]|nr:glycosyltransferase family 4 protein [Chitinispirillaceae bacterium]
MRLGIDAREIERGVHTGMGKALSVFLDYFDAAEDGNRGVLFSSIPVPRALSFRISNIVRPQRITLLWDQVTLPLLCKTERIDLLYSPYYKVPFFGNRPCVCTIYDLMYLTFPLYRKKSGRARLYYKTIGRVLVRKAARIVTSSDYSKKEIMAFYRVPEDSITVIPLGIPATYMPTTAQETLLTLKNRLAIRKDYILYTGNCKPHKNVEGLVRAFKTVHERIPEISLVLAGPLDRHAERIGTLITRSGLSSFITMTGALSEPDLCLLYCGARLFVMPSLQEGFGYPPIEAMACGLPVVCSNAASLPEVVGDAALPVDAQDPDRLSDAMIRVLESPDLARSLSEKGITRARRFSGDRYAKELYAVLKSVHSDQDV